jgi:hypothetical protein
METFVPYKSVYKGENIKTELEKHDLTYRVIQMVQADSRYHPEISAIE